MSRIVWGSAAPAAHGRNRNSGIASAAGRILRFARMKALLSAALLTAAWSLPGGERLVITLFGGPDCPACLRQKESIREMRDSGELPAGAEIVFRELPADRAHFEARGISGYPVTVVEIDGRERCRINGFCESDILLRLAGLRPASAASVSMRARVEAVSVPAACRESVYPNWNAALLVRPDSPNASPAVMVVPCRREGVMLPLPETGAVLEFQFSPWDECGEEIRSMGLADDFGRYELQWFFSPRSRAVPAPAEAPTSDSGDSKPTTGRPDARTP